MGASIAMNPTTSCSSRAGSAAAYKASSPLFKIMQLGTK